MAPTIAFLTARGVPVMGHVGLMPQSVNTGGYRARGQDRKQAEQIKADAAAVAEAGAFAIVLEGVVETLARDITVSVPVPTIGIGASPRSEEHTSELQSLMRLPYAGFCLKNKTIKSHTP